MRNLEFSEMLHVSAAASANCVSVETYEKVHNKAVKDATVMSLFGSALIGGCTGIFTGPAVGVGTGVFVASPIFLYSYFDSGAWSLIYNPKENPKI